MPNAIKRVFNCTCLVQYMLLPEATQRGLKNINICKFNYIMYIKVQNKIILNLWRNGTRTYVRKGRKNCGKSSVIEVLPHLKA